VSSLDLSSSGSYGVYHSILDTHTWMEKFGDPPRPGYPEGFAYHEVMSQLWGLIAIRLADIAILPFNHMAYADRIATEFVADAQALLDEQQAAEARSVNLGPIAEVDARARPFPAMWFSPW
jgi:N-acetylated-alpha-linked acidic dipeptidase